MEEIELDSEDREFLMPRLRAVRAGEKAQNEMAAYTGAIARHSGIKGQYTLTVDDALQKLMVNRDEQTNESVRAESPPALRGVENGSLPRLE